MTTLVVIPPPLKPSEPGLSGAAAGVLLRKLGAKAIVRDASIEWHRFALDPARLATGWQEAARDAASGTARARTRPGVLAAMRRAADSFAREPLALARPESYRSRARYSAAVAELEQALRLAAWPFPGVRLGVAMFALRDGRRLESSAVLAELAAEPGPFDEYFDRVLLPFVARAGIRRVAVSLTFQQQGPAAFRLAARLRAEMPALERVLGGPLVACWQPLGVDFARPPFDLFDRVLAGSDDDLVALAGPEAPRDSAACLTEEPRAGDLAELSWSSYLTPVPVVPAAFGRGCYWRRCSFCPDHLHPGHRACSPEGVRRFLQRVAARFPAGAMVHWTDSAVPIAMLELVADTIERDRLPIAWHGFVRVEPELARPELAARLARGGCAMLQLGIETASARLLELCGKGSEPSLARAVVRATAGAGIRNQIYLLFGLPTEQEDDREATLDFVTDEAASIDAVNPALLNLPRGSRMHRRAPEFGITDLVPFGAETDLSLYDDFRCGTSHPRVEARRWLAQRFFKAPALRAIRGALRAPFKANHLCFLEPA